MKDNAKWSNNCIPNILCWGLGAYVQLLSVHIGSRVPTQYFTIPVTIATCSRGLVSLEDAEEVAEENNEPGGTWQSPHDPCPQDSAFLSQFYWATKGRHLLFTSMKKGGYQNKIISMLLNWMSWNFLTLYNTVLEMLFPTKSTNPVLAYHVQWLKKPCRPVV